MKNKMLENRKMGLGTIQAFMIFIPFALAFWAGVVLLIFAILK